MKIIDYTTVRNQTLTHLGVDVRALISEGWQPIGGAIPCEYREYGMDKSGWVQTMIKYENDTVPTTCHTVLGPGG